MNNKLLGFALLGCLGLINSLLTPAAQAAAPTVTTLAATSVTGTNAAIHGTVNPNGAVTTAYFQYGLDTTYGNIGAFTALPATNVTQTMPGFVVSSLTDPVGAQWTQTSAPLTNWQGIASSADGTRLAATVFDSFSLLGYIYTSTNRGVTWMRTSAPTTNEWQAIASSANGTRLAAGAWGGGIYTSTNGGVTWAQSSAPSGYWNSIASSGTRLAAVDSIDGGIWTSTNGGIALTMSSTAKEYAIAASADGTRLAVVTDGGGIYTSTNGGITWTLSSAPSTNWYAVASSADGTRLAAAAYNGGIYISANSGVTWTRSSAPGGFFSIASSADGTRLVAGPNGGGGIYSSTNSGLTWANLFTNGCGGYWYSIASSADGTQLAAENDCGFIFTSTGAANNLMPATTYHYRLVGINSSGTTLGADQTFIFPLAPAVTTLAATSVTATNATLNGTVNSDGAATMAYFQYGTTTNYGSSTVTNTLAATNANVSVSNLLGSLSFGTVYHFRLVGANSAGTNLGGDVTFTTSPLAPVVTTLAATGVTTTSATLNGTVNPDNAATKAYFRYGLTPSYGSFSATNSLAATNTLIAVSNLISGLSPGTAYHYQLAASNSVGTIMGSDLTFTTGAGVPTAVTLAASGQAGNSATLNGTLTTGGLNTTAYFQYGLTTGYGSYSATNSRVATNTSIAVSNLISSLSAGTVYHFRLVATNSAGSSTGADLAFLSTPNIVINTADAGAGSLRGVIAASASGDTINFATNLSGQTIGLTTGQLVVSNNLTLDASALPGGITISGNGASRVLLITNNATVILKFLGISDGAVVGPGAGILNSTNCILTLTNCNVVNNSAYDLSSVLFGGGGIYNAGTLTLAGCDIENNTAIGRGMVGDIRTSGGFAAGGGIYNNVGTATLNGNTFYNNGAFGGPAGDADQPPTKGGNGGDARGGGIYNSGSLTLNQNSFAGNGAGGGQGGGAFMVASGTTAGNGGSSYGGGIYNAGSLTLRQNTLASNYCTRGLAGVALNGNTPGNDGIAQGGGIYNTPVTNCSAQNCLIARNLLNGAGNTPSFDVSGVFYSQGHNLVGATDGSTGFGTNGDHVGNSASLLNPLLGPLAPRGGPTWTMGLQPGSPAIDAGDDSVTNTFATDQRGTGFSRRVGSHVDIGAYEYGSGNHAPIITSLGTVSVTLIPPAYLGQLTVAASVNPNAPDYAGSAWVEYGLSTNYGGSTAPQNLSPGVDNVPLTQQISGLAAGQTWHYRWVATNFFGTNFSADQAVGVGTNDFVPTFTSFAAGSVTIDPVTRLASVTLSASVNPNAPDYPATVWVQYGVVTGYGLETTRLTVSPGTTYVPTAQPLMNLTPGLAWHYRWLATNFLGTNFSPDQTVVVGTLGGGISGIVGDINGNGMVDMNEVSAVLTNYNGGVAASNAYSLYTQAQINANTQSGIATGISTVTNSPNTYGFYTLTQYTTNFTFGRNTGRSDVTNAPNTYGLYTVSQLQALDVSAPLLARNPTNGMFKLTIGVQRAPQLTNFVAFPLNGVGFSNIINGAGKLEFNFTSTNNAAFFRLLSQ